MDSKVRNFLLNHHINVSQIMYMTHKNRKTVIQLSDGSSAESFIPLKSFVNHFSAGQFEIVNKGIAVAPVYISKIENNTYYMQDGAQFRGRVRGVSHQLSMPIPSVEQPMGNEWDQFSVLNSMPLPFCLMELRMEEKNNAIDFEICYCNRAMEKLEGKASQILIGQSFCEAFELTDKRCLVGFADVALNGGTKVIRNCWKDNINSVVHCFQPRAGFCACVLVQVGEAVI